jgi:alpha-ketoglutarate-dependent taurine dioxygenase
MKFFNTVTYNGASTASKLIESVKTHRVTHLSEVPEDIDCRAFYAELGSALGLLVLKDEDPRSGLLIDGSWSDVRYDKERSTEAYRYSDKHHSLHTDYSYVPVMLDMTFFFCLEAATYGGATVFVDPDILESALKEYDFGLYERLCSVKVKLSKSTSQARVEQEVSILSHDDCGLLVNWNYHRAKDVDDADVKGMVEGFHAFLEMKILLGGLYHGVKLLKGEGCFIHDRRVLHGRLSFIGPRHLCKGAIVLSNPDTAAFKLSEYPHKL